ncbi:hypothetical protein ACFPAF_17045 [Hymenobacter endophyticus]|uniref:Uncharacterized protein n=1 Tax=Hymenobacter endophyticus TaxID=3076335 RepID=A0ABU3TL50_9BACT|nr:hypothetical protein [Hymenobacter endophyticus]MDU0372112.1 hypothetical protein [Hymenobacter endophyticus]
MHLTTLLTQLPRLQAVALAPAVTEVDLLHLESCVRTTLENVASYRLVAATPGQVQEFFFLLEAYAQDLSPQPVRARQRLAQQALRLCQALAPPARS